MLGLRCYAGCSPVVVSEGYSGVPALRLLTLQPLLWSMGSGTRAPEHMLSSCVADAWSLRSTGDLPETQLASPALAGGFLTARHHGSPEFCISTVELMEQLWICESSLN